MDVHIELITTLLKGDGATQIRTNIAMAVEYQLNLMRNFLFSNVQSPSYGKQLGRHRTMKTDMFSLTNWDQQFLVTTPVKKSMDVFTENVTWLYETGRISGGC